MVEQQVLEGEGLHIELLPGLRIVVLNETGSGVLAQAWATQLRNHERLQPLQVVVLRLRVAKSSVHHQPPVTQGNFCNIYVTRPDPFSTRTIEPGEYFGRFDDNGRLERMGFRVHSEPVVRVISRR
ncbi:hypothetical protein D9M68_804850 [compost metagenome]